MSKTRTLHLKFDASVWTEDALSDMMEVINAHTAEDVEVIALPDSIEYLDEEQVEQVTSDLVKALEGDDDE